MQQHFQSIMAKKDTHGGQGHGRSREVQVRSDASYGGQQKVQFKSPSVITQGFERDSLLDFDREQLHERAPSYESKLISPLMRRKKKDLLSARRIQQKECNKFLQ